MTDSNTQDASSAHLHRRRQEIRFAYRQPEIRPRPIRRTVDWLAPVRSVKAAVGRSFWGLADAGEKAFSVLAPIAFSVLATALLVWAAFAITSWASSYEKAQAERREANFAREQDLAEIERNKAFRLLSSASTPQQKIDILMDLAEAGDPEAMLEMSFAKEELGAIHEAAEWDRRLSEADNVNGIGRYAAKTVLGQVPERDRREGARTLRVGDGVLSGDWEQKLIWVDGKRVSQELDPRVAAEVGRLYLVGIQGLLEADPKRASVMLGRAAKGGVGSAGRDWALLCATHYSPYYTGFQCQGFTDTLNSISDAGDGEVLFRQAQAYENGWERKPNSSEATRHYREARARGHVGAASRLAALNDPIVRGDVGWRKIYESAVAGDEKAKRYIGFGCARDTELAGPDHQCVLNMLAPLADESDPSAMLEVCYSYAAMGQAGMAANCEQRLAASGNANAKALYAIRLVTGEGVAADPVRGLEIVSSLSGYGLDPRTKISIGDGYLRARVTLRDWGSNAYWAAYWYNEAKDEIKNGWRKWVYACAIATSGSSSGVGWCSGYDLRLNEYHNFVRLSAEVKDPESGMRIAPTGTVESKELGPAGRQAQSEALIRPHRPEVESGTLPPYGIVRMGTPEEIAALRRKLESDAARVTVVRVQTEARLKQ